MDCARSLRPERARNFGRKNGGLYAPPAAEPPWPASKARIERAQAGIWG